MKTYFRTLPWQAAPFARYIVPFAGGIAIAHFYSIPPLLGWILTAVFFAALVLLHFFPPDYRGRYWFGVMLQFFLFLGGCQLTQAYRQTFPPDHFSTLLPTQPRPILLGRVSQPPRPGATVRLLVQVKAVWSEEACRWERATGKLLVYSPLPKSPSTGQWGIFHSRPDSLPLPGNPDGFNNRAYQGLRKVWYQSWIPTDQIQWVEGPKGICFPCWQEKLAGILHSRMTQPDAYAVAAAMVLGFRADMDDRLLDAYSETGAMHVLSVSGLHVGMVYIVLDRLWRKGRGRRWIRMLYLLFGIWFFCLLTGAAPCVLRSGVMFSFVVIGQQWRRSASIYNSLAASAFCLLAINPNWLFDIGFQLSHLALLGIVFAQPIFYRLVYLPLKLLDYLWQLLTVSLAAQLATLPLSLYYFHQMPTYFWLSGWLVVPAAALVLGLGIALLLLDPFWNWAAAWLGKMLTWVVDWTNRALFAIQDLPGSVWSGIYLSESETALWYGALLTAALAFYSWRGRWFVWSLGFTLLAMGGRIYFQYQTLQTEELILYQNRNGLIWDYFRKGKAWTNHTPGIGASDLEWSAQPHRIRMGCEQPETYPHSWEAGALCLGQYSIAWVDSLWNKSGTQQTNAVVVMPGAKARVEVIADGFPGATLILPADMPTRQRRGIRRHCEKIGVPVWDIKESGAYRIILSPSKRFPDDG